MFQLLACRSPLTSKDVVVWINEESVTVYDMQQAFFRSQESISSESLRDKKYLEKLAQKFLDELIQKRVLVLEARKQNIHLEENEFEEYARQYKSRYTEAEFQKILRERKIDYAVWKDVKRDQLLIQKLLERKVFPQIQISEEEIQRYYQEHLDQFTEPESVRVRQIVTDSKEKADAILKRLKSGENFARLATDLSIAPERRNGGDLGFINQDSFPKEFEVCFQLAVGELSEVVASAYGFHVFKIMEKKPAKRFELDEVKPQIEEWLKQSRQELEVKNFYQTIQSQYSIRIDFSVLKRIPFHEWL